MMLMDAEAFSAEELARALVVSTKKVEGFRACRMAMPLKQQLCLALLVIEKAPRYAREGRQLLGQVRAAIQYQAHETEIHDHFPPSRR